MTATIETAADIGVNKRLSVVFGDLQRAVGDVILKHGVTFEELVQAVGWTTKLAESGDLFLTSIYLFGIKPMEVSFGGAYANPEKDGASTWMPTGPFYVPGAPEITNPGVLPMRPDEPGETLIVSGVVRSTSGQPLAGAELDLWQTTAEGTYGGLTPEQAGPLGPLNVVDYDLPKYHLRGKLLTDAEGRYEYRTVLPGLESATPPGSVLEEFLNKCGRATSRARHIHAYVSSEGFHKLTHQIHFDDDPLVHTVPEGPIARGTVICSELHDDPAEWQERGLTGPYRTLTCDYILRPGLDTVEEQDPDGFWAD